LLDPQPVVRQPAVWAFSEMRFPEMAPAVAALLADHDASVRAEAAAALGIERNAPGRGCPLPPARCRWSLRAVW